VYGWTGGNQDVSAAGTTAAANVEVLGLVRLSAANPVGGSYSPRLVARAQADARNGYTARITHTTAGAVTWLLSRIDNAGGTGSSSLASGTLASSGAAGSRWWIRLRAQGTTIQARFWRDGTAEPTAWTASVTDGYWATGRPAVGVFAGPGLAAPYPDTGFATFDAVNLDKGPTATVPSAPTLTSATAGDRSVTVAWSAPAADGGSPLTGYKVTAARRAAARHWSRRWAR
jgi:hypothetical protein